MGSNNVHLFFMLVVLSIAMLIVGILVSVYMFARMNPTADNINTTRIEIDWINVVYAADGYLIDAAGEQKYFIFGAVKVHNRGAPDGEWIFDPTFYFEFDNKSTIAGNTHYEYFSQYVFAISSVLKGILATTSKDRYADFNRKEYIEYGLGNGAPKNDFEINLAFTKNGEIDIERSSVGVIPKELANESGVCYTSTSTIRPCSMYRLYSISSSAGLINAYAFGLIRDDFNKAIPMPMQTSSNLIKVNNNSGLGMQIKNAIAEVLENKSKSRELK